jgi:hypothetical protein
MKIGLLEFPQDPSEQPKHFITGAKARRLVEELRVAVRVSPTKIKLIVAHGWNVVKGWLQQTQAQRQRAEQQVLEAQDRMNQHRARIAFPDGAEYGFAPWPAKDQRSQFA